MAHGCPAWPGHTQREIQQQKTRRSSSQLARHAVAGRRGVRPRRRKDAGTSGANRRRRRGAGGPRGENAGHGSGPHERPGRLGRLWAGMWRARAPALTQLAWGAAAPARICLLLAARLSAASSQGCASPCSRRPWSCEARRPMSQLATLRLGFAASGEIPGVSGAPWGPHAGPLPPCRSSASWRSPNSNCGSRAPARPATAAQIAP